MNYISICLLVLIFSTYDTLADYQLKHVQVLFRHGDRAPTTGFPTDIYNASHWPNGLGELTDIGIIQQYKLGSWLRRRYHTLLGPTLGFQDIFIRSADFDRTLMSAEANVAGLMATDNHTVIPGLNWRPLPIHTVPIETDNLLENAYCPQYDREKDALYESGYFKKKFNPFRSFLSFMQHKSGIPDLTFESVWKLYDILFCERTHNMTENTWVTKEVWKNLTIINRINWELIFYKDLARFYGGLLLHTIADNMRRISLNETWPKKGNKMMMYSGHDVDVAPVAKLLGFYDNEQPPYASCIFFELYQDPSRTYSWAVKVLYRNTTSSSSDIPPSYLIPGCSSVMCPLSQFIEVTKDKSISKEDRLKLCSPSVAIGVYVLWTFVSVCVAVFLFIVVMFCVRYNRKRAVKYSRLSENNEIN